MWKPVPPSFLDGTRKNTLKSLITLFDQRSEKSESVKGKKNPITTKDAVKERCKYIQDQEEEAYTREGMFRFVLVEPYEPANPSTPIDKLKKVQVRDLIVGKRHKGTYIKIMITSVARRHDFAVDVMFEDEGGTFGILRVYFLDEENGPEDHLASGALFIIREPYLWNDGDNTTFVRVDHHSDMELIHCWDFTTEKHVPAIWRFFSPAEVMKAEGLMTMAEAFRTHKSFEEAFQMYSWVEQRAIREGSNVPKNILIMLYRGRLSINVQLRRYHVIAKDIEAYLKICPDDEQAFYLRALRLYYTGRYEVCQDEVNKLLEKGPETTGLKLSYLGRRAKERFEEVKLGKYNWRSMRQNAITFCSYTDHAEFSHPVKLKKTPKGRRIFTTRDVKRGDLLIVAKAIAITRHDDINMCVQLAPRNGKFECEYGCSAIFDLKIMERIRREGSEWFEKTLCLMDDDGSYVPTQNRHPDGSKIVDPFHIEAIRRRNSITISDIPLQQHRGAGYMAATPGHLQREVSYSCGMWFLPSFLRHSCISNAHRTVIGEMLIVRAGKDIPKDTKVTINFSTPSNLEYPMTDFVCTCPAHTHDLVLSGDPKDPENIAKMKRSIWYEFNASCQYIETAKLSPEKWRKLNLLDLLLSMTAILDKIRPTLPPANEVPQVQIAHRYRYIAAAYYDAGQRRHASCSYYKVLDCLGVDYMILEQFDEVIWENHGQCTDDLFHTYNDLSVLARTPGIKRCWRNAAIDTYEILFGERYSYRTVIGTAPFIEAKDKCKCTGVDNFMDADETQMRKRLGVDHKKEQEVRNTVDGMAMMQIMDDGNARACKKLEEKKKREKELGAERMAEVIRRREKERERESEREKRVKQEEAEVEEKKLRSEKENEKKDGGRKNRDRASISSIFNDYSDPRITAPTRP
ncbi:hypothetical protein TWF718_000355 [Orbilia javanica]|uniref:SET domain-containing protein n=1 Tax=Orbilia javanica TaxID=47235 RepID=A0AAN8RGC8_9PEZI